MNDKRKTRPGQGRESMRLRNHYTTRRGPVSSLLLRGQENAITLRELEAETGISGRDLRRMIETERRRGVPILSDNRNGYFLPADHLERLACVRSMRHRAREILKTAKALENGGE